MNVEYEAERNSNTKPFFIFGLSPYPDTCMYNCRTNLVFTVDGGTPCSIVWDPAILSSTTAGRWSKKTCQVTNKGLRQDRTVQLSNEGKIELQGSGPWEEDTFNYKIDVTVVGFSSFSIEGVFKVLCSSATTVVTAPATFSTDLIGFLKDSGTHSFKFPELVSDQCPIVKYEIDTYTSNKQFQTQSDQISIDTTEEGCLTTINTGSLDHYT